VRLCLLPVLPALLSSPCHMCSHGFAGIEVLYKRGDIAYSRCLISLYLVADSHLTNRRRTCYACKLVPATLRPHCLVGQFHVQTCLFWIFYEWFVKLASKILLPTVARKQVKVLHVNVFLGGGTCVSRWGCLIVSSSGSVHGLCGIGLCMDSSFQPARVSRAMCTWRLERA